jgi:uncharacterized MAPEG superfamily protein
MATELRILAWSVLFGLAQVLIAGAMGTQQRGLKWNVSNRDGTPQALTGAASRAARASRNFLETFGFFAAAVLGVVLAKQNSAHSALGSEIYLAARVAYFPIYVAGIPYLRTVVYGASLWGLLQVLEPLL